MARVFMYNGMSLEDPDPTVQPEEVKNIYSGVYSELVQAKIEGPHEKNGDLVYTFRKVVGTKGAMEDIIEDLQPIDIATELINSIVYQTSYEVPPSEALGLI